MTLYSASMHSLGRASDRAAARGYRLPTKESMHMTDNGHPLRGIMSSEHDSTVASFADSSVSSLSSHGAAGTEERSKRQRKIDVGSSHHRHQRPKSLRGSFKSLGRTVSDRSSQLKRAVCGVGRARWSDIEVDTRIGTGAFSMILRVSDRRHSARSVGGTPTKFYALKCLREGDLDSRTRNVALRDLQQEARILSRLKHPNIVRIKALGRPEANEDVSSVHFRYFFLMELLDGGTLQSRLEEWQRRSKGHRHNRAPAKDRVRSFLSSVTSRNKRQGNKSKSHRGAPSRSSSMPDLMTSSTPPSLYERLKYIAYPLSKALRYLEGQQVVHCDIKPGNIGFASSTCKLFDFGLSKDLKKAKGSHSQDGDNQEPTGAIVGSCRYMAPEVFQGYEPTSKSDVFSFGVVLWELVTLQLPHRGIRTFKDMYDSVVRLGERPSLDCIASSNLKELLESCFHPDPRGRPCFEEVVILLSEALEEVKQQHERDGQRPHDQSRRNLLSSKKNEPVSPSSQSSRRSPRGIFASFRSTTETASVTGSYRDEDAIYNQFYDGRDHDDEHDIVDMYDDDEDDEDFDDTASFAD